MAQQFGLPKFKGIELPAPTNNPFDSDDGFGDFGDFKDAPQSEVSKPEFDPFAELIDGPKPAFEDKPVQQEQP